MGLEQNVEYSEISFRERQDGKINIIKTSKIYWSQILEDFKENDKIML